MRGREIVGRIHGREAVLGAAPADRVTLTTVMAACAAALVAGGAPEAISEALPRFSGSRFRRQVVGQLRGIRAVNDSMATTPAKALAGLQATEGAVVWVAGGRASFWREDYESGDPALTDLGVLAAAAKRQTRMAFVFGPAGHVLTDLLEHERVPVRAVAGLAAAVAGAAAAARPGDTVLFSPSMYVTPEERAGFDPAVRDALLMKGSR